MDDTKRKELIDLAYSYTLYLLLKYGNKLNEEHAKAIYKIINGFVDTIEGENIKLAFPLFCGGGKTTCIRGLLIAITKLDLNYSVVVSASQIKALCDLKIDLISDGIPESKIGLIHSKQYDPEKINMDGYAQLPSNTNEEIQVMPFVLVSHCKIKHPKTCLESYNTYQDRKRNLVIWDESLLSGDALNLSALLICNSIDSAINGFEHKVQGKQNESDFTLLIDFLRQIKSILKDAKDNHTDIELILPYLPLELNKLKYQLGCLLVSNDDNNLKKLFDCIKNMGELRYLNEEQGAIIHFRQTIPEELDSIVILDASHSLRELTKSDESIVTVEMECPKSYENLTIKFFKSNAGRSSLEEEFFKNEDSKLVAEITEIINKILTTCPNESILIWNYKAKGNRSMAKVIRKRLIELNPSIDLDATNESGEKILNFSTYGNELGLNSFSHCKHSIFCGLLYLPRAYLAGMLKGLSKDMNRKVFENKLLENTVISEQAHILYQAVSRGSSRLTENGKCKEHSVYFFHPKPLALKRMLSNVFPSAKWKRYKAIHIDNKNGIYYEKANKINEQLNSLIESDFLSLNPRTKILNEVSTATLRKRYFEDVGGQMWSNVIKVFQEEFPWDWEIKGRSFVKS